MEVIYEDIALIKTNQSQFVQSLEFYGNKIDDFQSKLNSFGDALKTIDKLSAEVRALKDENKLLKTELDSLQQYTRVNDVIISGVPEKNGENIVSVVQTIGEKLNFPTNESHIDACHRIKTNNVEKSIKIILKLTTRQFKNDLLAAARSRRGLKAEDFGYSGNKTGIYLNDHLTSTNNKIFYMARQFCKENNYKYCWTKDCKIFVRQNDSSRIYRVTSEAGISSLPK